jgi:hypothetical protein
MKKLNKPENLPVSKIDDKLNIYDSENNLKPQYRRDSEPWTITGPHDLEPSNRSIIERIKFRLKNLGR